MEFKLKIEENYIQVDCPEQRYNLTIRRKDQKTPWRQIMFKQEVGISKESVYITGRTLEEYDEDVRNIPFDQNAQYMEIGAGLGGFIPSLIDRLGDSLNKKPIVVDQANYELMLQMLKRGQEVISAENYSQNALDNLRSFIERAEFYNSSDKIDLINLPFGMALRTFPDLIGKVDYLVDHRGSRLYPQIENSMDSVENYWNNAINMRNLRKAIMSPSGSFAGDF